MTRLRTFQTLRHVAQLFARDADPHGKRVVRMHDTAGAHAHRGRAAAVPGRRRAAATTGPQVTLRSVPNALRVVG